ncbi:hypothetical protein CLF_101026, partial [Clonorchis sinensis]
YQIVATVVDPKGSELPLDEKYDVISSTDHLLMEARLCSFVEKAFKRGEMLHKLQFTCDMHGREDEKAVLGVHFRKDQLAYLKVSANISGLGQEIMRTTTPIPQMFGLKEISLQLRVNHTADQLLVAEWLDDKTASRLENPYWSPVRCTLMVTPNKDERVIQQDTTGYHSRKAANSKSKLYSLLLAASNELYLKLRGCIRNFGRKHLFDKARDLPCRQVSPFNGNTSKLIEMYGRQLGKHRLKMEAVFTKQDDIIVFVIFNYKPCACPSAFIAAKLLLVDALERRLTAISRYLLTRIYLLAQDCAGRQDHQDSMNHWKMKVKISFPNGLSFAELCLSTEYECIKTPSR